MDGLEKITARISADADAEIQAIRDKANGLDPVSYTHLTLPTTSSV